MIRSRNRQSRRLRKRKRRGKGIHLGRIEKVVTVGIVVEMVMARMATGGHIVVTVARMAGLI